MGMSMHRKLCTMPFATDHLVPVAHDHRILYRKWSSIDDSQQYVYDPAIDAWYIIMVPMKITHRCSWVSTRDYGIITISQDGSQVYSITNIQSSISSAESSSTSLSLPILECTITPLPSWSLSYVGVHPKSDYPRALSMYNCQVMVAVGQMYGRQDMSWMDTVIAPGQWRHDPCSIAASHTMFVTPYHCYC